MSPFSKWFVSVVRFVVTLHICNIKALATVFSPSFFVNNPIFIQCQNDPSHQNYVCQIWIKIEICVPNFNPLGHSPRYQSCFQQRDRRTAGHRLTQNFNRIYVYGFQSITYLLITRFCSYSIKICVPNLDRLGHSPLALSCFQQTEGQKGEQGLIDSESYQNYQPNIWTCYTQKDKLNIPP